VRAASVRTGAAVLVLLVVALCGLSVPAAAATAGPAPRAIVYGHTAITTVLTSSTSVPSVGPKKGVRFGPILWAVPAVAVLAAAVATPLFLRRHRERSGPGRTSDDG
jgi:hypothetical protein